MLVQLMSLPIETKMQLFQLVRQRIKSRPCTIPRIAFLLPAELQQQVRWFPLIDLLEDRVYLVDISAEATM